MTQTLIKNALIVNEGKEFEADLRIKNGRIDQVSSSITALPEDCIVDAQGNYLIPGMIDDQVHFREPGLTHKGSIYTESRAAVAGGITSFMEMPNVNPSTTTLEALKQKQDIASQKSLANYAFYLGATEENIDVIKAVDPTEVCGVKVFMGASTGGLLVQDPDALDAIFKECPILIATHCESSPMINQKMQGFQGEPQITDHPYIRDAEACYASSSFAVGLAKKHNSQLHVLHITTEKELSLFEPGPIEGKNITAEACVHHLWFSEADYPALGNRIKCNPAIKAETDRAALIAALKSGQIDIIATDHAPHTLEEKQVNYSEAPAGLPLVEHALHTLFDQVKAGRLTMPQVVEKTSHNPAKRYKISERGFIREGYFADLTLINANQPFKALDSNVHYLCGWTPFHGQTFSSTVLNTWVNGTSVYQGSSIIESPHAAMPLLFKR